MNHLHHSLIIHSIQTCIQVPYSFSCRTWSLLCHYNLCCTSLCCTSLFCTSLCCTSLCSIFLCCASVCYTLLCCKDANLVQCLHMPTVVFSQRSLLCRCNLSCTSSWCTSLWCTSPWCTFMYCIFLLCTLLGCNLYSASIRQQSSFPSNRFCVAAT